MGRAIVRRPQVFLMDEPLSNLDAKLRVQTRTQIAELQRRFAVTTLYVTHDQVEALTMGDRIAVLRDGVMLQCDTPRAVFSRPVNAFVAGFIGSPAMNLTPSNVTGEHALFGGLDVLLTRDQVASLSGSSVTIGVRPESFRVVTGDQPGIDVVIESVEELGSDTYLYTSMSAPTNGDDRPTLLTVRCEPFGNHQRGDRMRLLPDLRALHLFDGETGQRLPD
jgi:multiple sugar transport system ATP-binding protein